MNEELDFCLESAEENMQAAISHLEKELSKVRAGRANPQILDGVKVDYYGTDTPISQVSNISASDARTLVIQAWEKTMIAPIEKAIHAANLGLNPINNGELIRINIPALTEERRRDLVKQVKKLGEETKVSIRSARKDANDEIKQLQKDGLPEDSAKNGEDLVQDLTNKYSDKVEKVLEEKEKEIMTV